MSRPAQAELVAELGEAVRSLTGRVTELVELSRGNILNHVLHSGAHRIGADGYVALEFTVPMASVAVLSGPNAAATAVAVASPPTSPPPTVGIGVVPIRPGWYVCAPLTGTSLTVYGAAGDFVWIGVWARPQPPTAAAGPLAAVAEAAPASSQAIASVPCRYLGFSLRDSGGAGATVRIRDGSATGPILETIELSPSESRSEFYEGGVVAATSLYYELVAGTVEGSVRHSGG